MLNDVMKIVLLEHNFINRANQGENFSFGLA
jgi:hypothetical protein